MAKEVLGPITEFKGKYRFLSNFYDASFPHNGLVYPTNEHFYQAHKAQSLEDFRQILNAPTPGVAKRLGGKIVLVDNWDIMKEAVMFTGLQAKFAASYELQQYLMGTHPVELIEGNWWGDKYWGLCLKTNEGQNRLGQLLMIIRAQLRGVI